MGLKFSPMHRREIPVIVFIRLLAATTALIALGLAHTAGAQEADEAGTVTAPAPQAPPAHDTMAVAGVALGALSYYGNELAGHRTSSGERFDPKQLTMAHKSLPFGTLVRVTNLRNNKSVVVRVNDRGPHVSGRVGDVSMAAAIMLDMLQAGVVQARFEVLRKRH